MLHDLIQALRKSPPSVIALVVANVVPLFGVLLFDWSVFAVMALYWSENVIIGVINVLKMIACTPDPSQVDFRDAIDRAEAEAMLAAWSKSSKNVSGIGAAHQLSKLFFIPFFVFHYGLFCAGHGVFIVVLFGADDGGLAVGPGLDLERLAERLFTGGLILGLLSLTASHVYSFISNYLVGGEFRRTIAPSLMLQPYGRVVVLHVAILLGGLAAMSIGSSVVALLILIVGKTV
ncbi:MAG: DUF6498-containing protein, partial [Planctomycetota bacterium]